MDFIHGVKALPRWVGSALAARRRVTPAVVVTGARQTGKSTLAEQLVGGDRSKVFWGGTGVALHLAGTDEPDGAHFENLVLHDLLVWRDARIERAELGYWRTTTGEEVDFVVETGGRLLPIEVKATSRPRLTAAAHLRAFRAEYGSKTRAGLLLHTGSTLEWLAPDVLAVPWWKLL